MSEKVNVFADSNLLFEDASDFLIGVILQLGFQFEKGFIVAEFSVVIDMIFDDFCEY